MCRRIWFRWQSTPTNQMIDGDRVLHSLAQGNDLSKVSSSSQFHTRDLRQKKRSGKKKTSKNSETWRLVELLKNREILQTILHTNKKITFLTLKKGLKSAVLSL